MFGVFSEVKQDAFTLLWKDVLPSHLGLTGWKCKIVREWWQSGLPQKKTPVDNLFSKPRETMFDFNSSSSCITNESQCGVKKDLNNVGLYQDKKTLDLSTNLTFIS